MDETAQPREGETIMGTSINTQVTGFVGSDPQVREVGEQRVALLWTGSGLRRRHPFAAEPHGPHGGTPSNTGRAPQQVCCSNQPLQVNAGCSAAAHSCPPPAL
jgi:hypothetical protein